MNDGRNGPGRRQVLLGLGAAGVAGLAGGGSAARAAQKAADAPRDHGETQERQPFLGVHQTGVTTPRPAAGMVAAFGVIAETPDDLERMFRTLTERIAFLMAGGPVPEIDPGLPPLDSGILGPVVPPDNLTVTVSLGDSFFAARPWLAALKPKHLQRMTAFPNDALRREVCHGDLALQICANTPDTAIHALRDIIKTLPEFLVLRWKQEGTVPVIPARPDGETESARNFLGFRDGSANPDSNDAALMERLVWVTGDAGEPAWAVGGSYQAVRIIRNFVERWDRTPLREQEQIFGRRKASGAPMDGRKESDVPDYARDPEGKVTPMDAHIRLANPRTKDFAKHLILRRPFNYSNGVTKAGQLDQGLLFIAYQADLAAGFIAVQSLLNGEPLEEYIQPVGGGYFFVLPGVRGAGDYLGRTLVEAARGPALS
ncbi:MAG: iron uptake transporter deferrochelatase/peroxidase subunit [Rhodospirillaceae bacterium]